MMTSLKTKLMAGLGQRQQSPFSAGGWATLTYIITYALDALLFFPLAWFLEDSAFGLYAEATLIYAGLVLVVQINLIRALVRTPGDRAELAVATFWLSLVFGLAGALVCALAGLPMAFLYNTELLLILGLMAPGVLAAGLSAVPLALLSRELDFRRRMLPETVSVGVAAVLGLGAAALHAGVYSLIIYAVSRTTLSAIIAWWVVWNKDEVKRMKAEIRKQGFLSFILHPSSLIPQLLGFGVPATGGELALYARFNVDYAIGGLSLGEAALGTYSLAWKVSDRASRLINVFFDEVGYATFARLQAQRERLVQVFLSATRLFMVIAVPIFFGALLVRGELVAGLLGTRRLGMVEPLLPLFILQALWLVFHPSQQLLLALGHSRLYAWLNGLSLVLTALAVFIGTTWGIVGIAWAMLAVNGSVSLLWGGLALYFLRPGPALIWQTLQLPLLFAVTTLPAIALTNWLAGVAKMPSLVRFGAALLVAIIVFALVAWRTWPALRGDIALLRQSLPEESPNPALVEEIAFSEKIEAAR